MSVNYMKFQVVEEGIKFSTWIIMWWAGQALDDPNQKLQPRPLLNGSSPWRSRLGKHNPGSLQNTRH